MAKLFREEVENLCSLNWNRITKGKHPSPPYKEASLAEYNALHEGTIILYDTVTARKPNFWILD